MRSGIVALGVTSTLVLALLLAACQNGSETPAGVATPTATSETAQAIPQEALPDTLPDPFIFRSDGTPLEADAEQEIIYTVQPGENLATIAAQFDVTVAEIQRLNGIADPSVLRAGDELRIPIKDQDRIAASSDAAAAQEGGGPPPGEPYTVEPGDTLFDIGVRFGFDWEMLQAYNNLTDFQAGNLQAGQVLIIPPPQDEEEAESEPPG